jgi:hypothetical protein
LFVRKYLELLIFCSRCCPIAGLALTLCSLSAQTRKPTTHRLEATPTTVAYGFYWSEAKPVLRIVSGDIIDVDTLLTNTPGGLSSRSV